MTAETYWSRPFAVYWQSSHFSGEFRFNTLDEAYEYIAQQWSRIRETVKRERYTASNLRASKLITPTATYSLRDVMLCDDVSSY